MMARGVAGVLVRQMENAAPHARRLLLRQRAVRHAAVMSATCLAVLCFSLLLAAGEPPTPTPSPLAGRPLRAALADRPLPAAAAGRAETVLYLGDPQIGFSGNETEDAIRFGLVAAAARGADAVIIAGDMCAD